MAHNRRRGSELEDTLLVAAFEELAAVGYVRLTMEGVAARARTGKQVLYRRWPNRAALVIAAVRHVGGSIGDQVPDTGSLREDVLVVLRHMVARLRQLGPDVVHGLLAELPDLDLDVFDVMDRVMRTVLEQADKRGEIALAALTPRLVTLPADLLRHDLLLTRREVSDATLASIVDDVFLPLVRNAPSPA